MRTSFVTIDLVVADTVRRTNEGLYWVTFGFVVDCLCNLQIHGFGRGM